MSMRSKSRKEGTAAKLEAGSLEMMEQVNAMHNACVEDAEEGSVERTFRKAGWFAYEPGARQLQVAEGARWAGMPLGGGNLSTPYLKDRFSNLDEKGVPKRPDWTRLHALRLDMAEKARIKKDEKKKGVHKSVMASLQEKSSLAKLARQCKSEVETLAADVEADSEKDSALGFLREYLMQNDYAEEREFFGSEEISIDLKDIGELEKQPESAWWKLPPKRRREIIEDASCAAASSQLPGRMAKNLESKVDHGLKD